MIDIIRRLTFPPMPMASPAVRFYHAICREGEIWEIIEVLHNTKKPDNPVTCIAIRGRYSYSVNPFFHFDKFDVERLEKLSHMEREVKMSLP